MESEINQVTNQVTNQATNQVTNQVIIAKETTNTALNTTSLEDTYSIFNSRNGLQDSFVDICIACANFAKDLNHFNEMMKTLDVVAFNESSTPVSDSMFIEVLSIALSKSNLSQGRWNS